MYKPVVALLVAILIVGVVSCGARGGGEFSEMGVAIGQVRSSYNKGRFLVAEGVIARNGGDYGDSRFFPYSVNLLIRRGLDGRDAEGFHRALDAIASMEAKTADYRYAIYRDFIPYLQSNGLRTGYGNSGAARCARDLELLERMDKYESQFGFGNGFVDSTYWYALYVNDKCSTARSRAVLIRNLSEIDATLGKSVFHELIESEVQKGSSPEVLIDHLCNGRRWQESAYTGRQSALEEAGLLICKESVDEMAERLSPPDDIRIIAIPFDVIEKDLEKSRNQ